MGDDDWPRKITQETGIPHGTLACPNCGAVVSGAIPEPVCRNCGKAYWPEWLKEEGK